MPTHQQKEQQAVLFATSSEQDRLLQLQQAVQRLEAENAALRKQVTHLGIASEKVRGVYATFVDHAVVPDDGVYIRGIAQGNTLTIYLDWEEALLYGFADEEEQGEHKR